MFRNGDGVVPEGLTERQFVDHCLRYHDRRFHKHVPFFFCCYFRQMRARVNQLAVMATNRDVVEPARAEEQYEPPNVEELLEAAVAACGKGAYADATKRAMKLASKLNSFGHCLPGTTVFMAMHRRQLHAALASGCMTPESYTWFFSHAANDLFWREFFYIVDPDLQVSSLSKQQRRAYLAENPVLACLHYMDRLAAFQLHILRGRAPPLGPLTTQYHVNEDNQRLSNHTHSVAGTPAGGLIARDLARGDWSAGAAFLDAHVTANIGKPTPGFSLAGVKLRRGRRAPRENVDFNGLHAKLPEDINHPAFRPVPLVPTSSPEGQADAQALQRALEVHRCYTYYCCQKGPCRFGAPWVLRPDTQFVKVSKRRSGRFMPKRDNRYVNQCNLRMLRAWRGNVDVQLLADPYGTLEYVTTAVNYSSKTAEPLRARMDAKFRAMMRALPADTPPARQVAKAFNARMGMDQVSSQKAVAFLLGPNKWFAHNTETFVKVLAFPKHRTRHVVRSAKELQNMDARDTGVFRSDLMVDAYISRPSKGAVLDGDTGERVRWSTMTEAYFREWFVRAPKDALQNRVQVGGFQFRQVQRRQILVVTPVINSDPRDEDSAYALLRLHVPHRGDIYDGFPSAVARLKAIGFERLSPQGRAVMAYAKAQADNRAQVRDAADRDVLTEAVQDDDGVAMFVAEHAIAHDGDRVDNQAVATNASATAPGIVRASSVMMKSLSKYVEEQRKRRERKLVVEDARFD